ncbi:MAG: flagellar hook-length control protein FliK [Clostridium sp.]|nr:flagellar hook-length control protein FliK [Clostridium sp.]MCM1547569.1 flagellar hook-length control protein FliK [Ruminococcus sp.]
MDMTQISQNLGTQTLQQNGVSEGQVNSSFNSDFSFSDLIMSMISNTQTSGDLQETGLLNTFMGGEAQTGSELLNSETLLGSGLFGNGIMNDDVLKIILQNSSMQNNAAADGQTVGQAIDIEAFKSEFGSVIDVLAKNLIDGQDEVQQIGMFKPNKAEMPQTPKIEQNAKNQFFTVSNETVKTEQPTEQNVQKPEKLMFAMQQKVEAEKTEQLTAEEMPTEQNVQKPEKQMFAMPREVEAEKTEQPTAEAMPTEQNVQKSEKPMFAMPREVEAEKTEQPTAEATPTEQNVQKPEKPMFVMQREVEAEKTEQPTAEAMPAEQNVQKPEKPMFVMPQKVEAEKAEQPTPTEQNVQKPEKPMFVMQQKVEAEKAEQLTAEATPTEQNVQKPEKPMFVMPREVESEKAEQPTAEATPTEQNVQKPEKPMFVMPREVESEKAEQPTAEAMPAEQNVQKPEKPMFAMPKRISKPVERPMQHYVERSVFAEAQDNNEIYYPVNPQNDSAVYNNMMQYAEYFGMPQIRTAADKKDVKMSDFSEDIIKADPAQLSGLLGVVMTGNSIPQNNEILSTLYKEVPVNTESMTADSTIHNTTAFDFVNKYIESGEMEIVGYKPNAEINKAPVESEQKASDIQQPVRQQTKPTEESGKEVLNFMRTMQSAKSSISTVKKAETPKPAEIETLQKDMSELDIRFDKIDSEIKMKETFEAPEKQLLKGVQENLQKGNKEFTVKLRPEGLGEIIVKLVKSEGGKMFMSMAASSAKTAQLLNSNLSTLQSSLSQHNVEILNTNDMTQTVMPMNPAFEQYYGQQNDAYQQQNQQFRHQNQNQGHMTYAQTDDAETFDAKASAPMEQSGLDIMI